MMPNWSPNHQKEYAVMAEYRKLKNSDTWHWCTNCSNYPKGRGIYVSNNRQSGGEKCNECLAKTKRGDCRS